VTPSFSYGSPNTRLTLSASFIPDNASVTCAMATPLLESSVSHHCLSQAAPNLG
jgi:hypothetical protein